MNGIELKSPAFAGMRGAYAAMFTPYGQDGKVNNNTTVKIESGTIDENVYGGGLGTAATVSGNTTVTIGK